LAEEEPDDSEPVQVDESEEEQTMVENQSLSKIDPP